MINSEQVDLAVWDVTGEFLASLVAGMGERESRRGPKILVQTGLRHGHRLAVGRPNRLTAASRASFNESLGALVHAHRPIAVAVVGPASAPPAAGVRIGSARVSRRILQEGAWRPAPKLPQVIQPARFADFVEGSPPTGSEQLSVDWAQAASRAVDRYATPAVLIGVVTRLDREAPVSRRPTLARAAGRWLGAVLAGKPAQPAATVDASELNETINAVLASV